MPRRTSPVTSTDEAAAQAEAAQQDTKRRKPEPAEDSGDGAIVGDVIETAIDVITGLLSDG